jgi:hypothetical protein
VHAPLLGLLARASKSEPNGDDSEKFAEVEPPEMLPCVKLRISSWYFDHPYVIGVLKTIQFELSKTRIWG